MRAWCLLPRTCNSVRDAAHSNIRWFLQDLPYASDVVDRAVIKMIGKDLQRVCSYATQLRSAYSSRCVSCAKLCARSALFQIVQALPNLVSSRPPHSVLRQPFTIRCADQQLFCRCGTMRANGQSRAIDRVVIPSSFKRGFSDQSMTLTEAMAILHLISGMRLLIVAMTYNKGSLMRTIVRPDMGFSLTIVASPL